MYLIFPCLPDPPNNQLRTHGRTRHKGREREMKVYQSGPHKGEVYWITASLGAEDWLNLMRFAMQGKGVDYELPVRIVYEAAYPNRAHRMDADGVVGAGKMVLDAAVRCGLLTDDNPDVVAEVVGRTVVDKSLKEPQFRMWLETYEKPALCWQGENDARRD